MQHKRRSWLWLLITIIGLLLGFSAVSAQQPAFLIGVLDDADGAISSGARLAVREINAAGGVRGADGTIFSLALMTESPNASQTLAQAVANLNAAHVIAVLGPETSGDVLDGMTALQSLGVPVITPATDDTILTTDRTGLIFRSRAADALQGQALANYLISDYHLSPVATVQLDIASTARVVGFTTAASLLGVVPEPAIVLGAPSDLANSVVELVTANPAVIVAYGAPDVAAGLYSSLRAQGWTGVFAYNQAFEPAFRNAVPVSEMTGVVAVTTWPFTAVDLASTTFMNAYVRAYGELPDAIQAASYDSVNLISKALALPGSLRDNLAGLSPTPGVQGLLKAADIGSTDLSNNVAIVRAGDLGAPEVLARYQGAIRLPADIVGTSPIPIVTVTPYPSVTSTPAATATPEGVTITVKQQVQNVRSGPGNAYEIIGQMHQGDQAAVVGTNADFSWVVINFRGTQGWLATYLLDVFGDLNTTPIVPAPPIPTPDVTATPTLAPVTDLIIVSASITPNPLLPNQPFTVNITVGNIGNIPAGPFAIAGTFPPNNLFLTATLPGLGPGQQAAVTLSGVLSGVGSFTTSLQIDANNQVNEGTVGEQNNIYNLSYSLGVSVLNSGSATLNLGDTLDLEGNLAQGDVNWNSDGGTLGLKSIFGSRLGVMGTGDFNAVTYDSISPSITTRDSIPRTEMSVGTLIGIVTADGHRGVMQVTAVSDTQLGLNYRVYNG